MPDDFGPISTSAKSHNASGSSCKGICTRYKASKPAGSARYSAGQKRCQICDIFIKWDDLWCPCCGYRLRTKPRNSKHKAKLRARLEAQENLSPSLSPESKKEDII